MALAGMEWISSLTARWVSWVVSHRKAVVVVSLLLSVACTRYAMVNLGINTDTANMISASLPWRKDFIEYRQSFPVRDRNIVIVVDAPTSGVADDFATRLSDALRADTSTFESVYLAGSGDFFDRNGLLYLSTDSLEHLSDRLAAAQPLLGLLRQRFNGAGIVAAFRRIAKANPAQAPADPAAIDALYVQLGRSIEAAADGKSRPLSWRQLLGVNTPQGTQRLVLVRPVLNFKHFEPAAGAIAEIRSTAATLRRQMQSDVSVRLTGTVAMQQEELLAVSRSAGLAGLASLVLVGIVLYWALRSMRLLVISLVTLLVGLTWTAAFAAIAVGHLNLLSIAFAVLYVGLGVDFILHVSLRYKELLAHGADVSDALIGGLRSVGGSLFICAVTTAAGFYSFVPTPFDGVSELGLISGTGIFISLFVSVTVLPAFIAQFVPLQRAGKPLAIHPARISRLLVARPRLVVAVAVVLLVAALAALPKVSFDSNPIHLRDPASESVTTLKELSVSGEAPLFNLVAIADDHRTAVKWAMQLKRLAVVKDVRTVDSLVPKDQKNKLAVLDDISLLMGPDFASLKRAPADSDGLKRELMGLQHDLSASGADSQGAVRLRSSLSGLLAKLQDTSAAHARQMLTTLGSSLTQGLPTQLERLQKELQARSFDRQDLPPELAGRWINKAGQELIEIVPAEDIDNNAAAARFVSAVRRVVPHATGLPVVNQKASATVIEAFTEAMSYAVIMITIILLVFLRKVGDTLLVMVPITFAALVTAGATVWLGVPFNFANIIALPLLIGVGVDNGIHIVHRMRTEPPKHGSPLSTSTSRAILTSGLTTIASFGNLAFAAHVGIASMGRLLTLGMAVTLVATLILLPALLKLGPQR